MPSDPLLQPYRLKHLLLRNRLMSTAHEPTYTEDGLPKERYRLYHAEKAKGGLALTMIGGSSVVAPDSPQAFGNILLYKDEVVSLAKGTGRRRAQRGCGGDDPDDASRPANQLEQGGLAAGPGAVERPRADAPRLPQGHGGLGHRTGDRGVRRRRRAGQSRRPRRPRARMLRPPDRSVLVARRQPARRCLRRIARQSDALRPRGPRRRSASGSARISSSASAWSATRIGTAGSAARTASRSPNDSPLRASSTSSTSSAGISKPRRRCRTSSPAWARDRRPTSIFPARSGGRRGCRPSMRRASRTWRRRATPSPAASSTWSA